MEDKGVHHGDWRVIYFCDSYFCDIEEIFVIFISALNHVYIARVNRVENTGTPDLISSQEVTCTIQP